MFEKAFAQAEPAVHARHVLPAGLVQGRRRDRSIRLEENRQKQVVGLIRTQFLKRFESSVRAFELSCDRLLKKLLAFLEVHSETEAEKRRLERWKARACRGARLREAATSYSWMVTTATRMPTKTSCRRSCSTRSSASTGDEYDVVEMIQETYLDLEQLVTFLDEARKFEPKHDDKLQKLIRLLKSKELDGQKVLIFTEFADTARYLKRAARQAAGIEGVAQVDSATKANRADVIHRFAPYYNGSTSAELAATARSRSRILISTDVLSEGLNLQDASRMINYDIHWNPVRLMQRIGRVDRRMNPEVEKRLVADHPEVASSRGKVSFWNFLPPDELNAILTLYTRVTQKTLLISKTLGIEGQKLLTPEDDFEALQEFNHAYEGTKTAVEEMHLEYQELLAPIPRSRLAWSSCRAQSSAAASASTNGLRGVFFCYALPALDKETNEFTAEAGTTRWYLYDLDRDAMLEEPGEIVASIRSKPETPRQCTIGGDDPGRDQGQGREAHQEHLHEAARCPARGKAVAEVLDGTERGLN